MFTRKRIAMMFVFAALAVTAAVAQGPTWTSSKIEAYNGYDYELWNQNNSGNVSMKLTGDNGSGANAVGGTFTATWSGTENVLFRSGKKWGSNSTTTVSSIGNATVEFAATWSSGDNVKMLGVYGWAYFPSGSVPSNFTDQIEYYIIQDRGSYNSASQGTNSQKKGSATIDGIAYDFYVADRMNQPNLTGNGNFKQYFSVPASTSGHRTSGTITVSKHFEEWHKAGMTMSTCRLYEIAMKVESYTGSSKNSSGNATVTKNLLTIGGAVTPPPPAGNFTLTATPSPAAGGTIAKTPNADSYAPNTSVSLAATAASGWKFVRWEGGATGTTSPATVTMNANKTVTAVFSQVEDGTTNLIKDGNFPGTSLTSNWTLGAGEGYGGSTATSNVSGNKATITVTKAGEKWEPQLTQKGIALTSGQTYTLSFTASGSGTMQAMLQNGEEYNVYGEEKEVTLTSAAQEYTLVVKMPSTDENVQLAFNLGQASNVTLSNVKLVAGGTSTSIRDGSKAAIVRSSHAPMISVKGAMLNVSSSAGNDLKLRVVDVKGKTVAKFSAVGGGKYSLAKMPAGRYIVELKGVGIKQTSAIIVK